MIAKALRENLESVSTALYLVNSKMERKMQNERTTHKKTDQYESMVTRKVVRKPQRE